MVFGLLRPVGPWLRGDAAAAIRLGRPCAVRRSCWTPRGLKKAARIAPGGLFSVSAKASGFVRRLGGLLVEQLGIDLAGFGFGIISLGETCLVTLEHRGHDVDALRLQLGLFGRAGNVHGD